MKNFTNDYVYENTTAEEISEAYYKDKAFPVLNIVLIVLIGILGLILVVSHKSVMSLGVGICTLLVLAVMPFEAKKKVAAFTEVYRNSAQKGGMTEGSTIVTEITDTECIVNADQEDKKKSFALNSMKDSFETPNYYAMVFDEHRTALVSKKGFRNGTAAEFAEFFRTFPQEKQNTAEQSGCLAAIAACCSYFVLAM